MATTRGGITPLYVLGVFPSTDSDEICQAPNCRTLADRRFAVVYRSELSVYHLCDCCAGVADDVPIRQLSIPLAPLDYSTVPGDGCRRTFPTSS